MRSSTSAATDDTDDTNNTVTENTAVHTIFQVLLFHASAMTHPVNFLSTTKWVTPPGWDGVVNDSLGVFPARHHSSSFHGLL
jgi:hypothetical protein